MKTQTTLIIAALLISGCITPVQETTPTTTTQGIVLPPQTTLEVTSTTPKPATKLYVSGKVYPPKQVKVDLLKDSAIESQALTDAAGGFIFNVSEGDFALQFTDSEGRLYIYDDATNIRLSQGIKHEINGRSSDEPYYTINLSQEKPDYFAGIVELVTKKNVSEKTIESISRTYNCTIENRHEFSTLPIVSYTLRIPPDKSIFEMEKILSREDNIDRIEFHRIAFTGV